MLRGKLVVVEGIDGSGKNTQTKRLFNYLNSRGLKTNKVTFPEYEKNFFGKEIGYYLNGVYGSNLHPKFASLLYALDRHETRPSIVKALNKGVNVISDRYVSSNIAHQALKVPLDQREEITNWINHVEFNILKLPEPDMTILLDIPPSVSSKLIELKEKRNYTSSIKDIHEADTKHLEEAYRIYIDQAEKNNWARINCVEKGSLRSVEDISKELCNVVESFIKGELNV